MHVSVVVHVMGTPCETLQTHYHKMLLLKGIIELKLLKLYYFKIYVPRSFWADAASTTCFFINHLSSSILMGDIPY